MSDAVVSGYEIGRRCRKYRNAHGWSQEKLGRKIGVLGATISKYEKEGLFDIEKVQELSIALGINLMNDEIDEEGEIGEIGKEILIKLIENNGNVSYKDISAALRGMNSERVGHEILKLSGLGMCVREIYKDFCDNEQDKVFITAKGVITCKNKISNPLIEKRIQNMFLDVITYEELLAGNDKLPTAACYQEYIDLRPGERLIRNLPFTETFYKANFIKFLKENYETGIDKESFNAKADELIPSKNFYYDFLYRMMAGLDNDRLLFELYIEKWAEKHPEKLEESDEFEGSHEIEEDYLKMQELEQKAGMPSWEEFSRERRETDIRKMFSEKFNIVESEGSISTKQKKYPDFSRLTDEETKFWDRYVEKYIVNDLPDEGKTIQEKYTEAVEAQHRRGNLSPYPCDWYSAEEMLKFARENYGKPQNEDEEKIEKIIEDISKYYPKAKKEYLYGKAFIVNASTGAPKELEDYILTIF